MDTGVVVQGEMVGRWVEQGAVSVDVVDGAKAGMCVEGVAVYAVRGFLGGEKKDGACVGVGRGGLCFDELRLEGGAPNETAKGDTNDDGAWDKMLSV